MYLTILIAGYKPDYEILISNLTNKSENLDSNKLKENTLNISNPYILVKNDLDTKEEVAQIGTITKLSSIQAVKDKQVIKTLLDDISNAEIENTRIRNRDIKEDISQSTYYEMNYYTDIDLSSIKNIFSSTNHQTTSFTFDRIAVSQSAKNTIYLYKKGVKSFLQIETDSDIYEKVEQIFASNLRFFSKYSINNQSEFYIQDSLLSKTYDVYSVKEEDIGDIANKIFIKNNGLKISNIDSNTREISDGYSILKDSFKGLVYINPSNTDKYQEDNKAYIQGEASNFLSKSYDSKEIYDLLSIKNNVADYKETYKDSLVFSENYESSLSVLVGKEGVSKVNMPKLFKDKLLSSKELDIYQLENISQVLNYIFVNTDLTHIKDISLAYTKSYSSKDGTFSYTPEWYINYQDTYYRFKDLQEKVKQGEI